MNDACCREGKHVFHAWTDPADAAAVAAAFLAGARHGDACIFFGDELSAARLRNRLGRSGATDVSPRDFVHIRPDDVFTDGGPSPIGGLIALRNRLASEALVASRQVRLIIMPGSDTCEDGHLRDRAEAFESMFTSRGQPPHNVLGLCLYDARRYPADHLELASAAHPWIMRDGRIVANPLHEELLPEPGSRVA
jgi:hypothetical protein